MEVAREGGAHDPCTGGKTSLDGGVDVAMVFSYGGGAHTSCIIIIIYDN